MKRKVLSIALAIMVISSLLIFTGCGGVEVTEEMEAKVRAEFEIQKDSLKGDKGDTGVAGSTGPKGEQGDRGYSGTTGVQGIPGIEGVKGDQGEQGVQGVPGFGGCGPQGLTGPAGPAGPVTTPLFTAKLEVKIAGQALALTTSTQVYSSNYAALLQTTGTVGNGDEARLVLTPVKPITLGQITTITWQEYLNAGYPPHVDITVVKADGTLEAIVIEYAHNTATHYAEAPMPYGALTGAWYSVFSDDAGGPAVIADTAFGWAATGAAGPYLVTATLPVTSTTGLFIGDTLAQWKAGQVVTGISGDSQVINITIEVDNYMVQSDAYLDTVAVNGIIVWE